MHQTEPKHCCLILYLNKSHICSSKTPEGRPQPFTLATFLYEIMQNSSILCHWHQLHVNSPLRFQKITLQSQALHRVRKGLTVCLSSCMSLQVKWLCNWICLLYLIVGYLKWDVYLQWFLAKPGFTTTKSIRLELLTLFSPLIKWFSEWLKGWCCFVSRTWQVW